MLSVKRIKYNQFYSSDFGLLCDVMFDDDMGQVDTFLNREAVKSERWDGKFTSIYRYKYTDTFSPTFTFTKKDFSDFTLQEQREVYSWLTSKVMASSLDILDADCNGDINTICTLIGGFTEINSYKASNGRVIGIVATFENIYPWALSPVRIFTKEISEPTTLYIDCNNDEVEDMIYPKIKIYQNEGIIVNSPNGLTNPFEWLKKTVYHTSSGYYWEDKEGIKHQNMPVNSSGITTTSVLIHNKTTKTYSWITGNSPEEIITLDGASKVISTDLNSRGVIGNDFNWHWLELQTGVNEIEIIGNCTISFEWREPMKVGEWT